MQNKGRYSYRYIPGKLETTKLEWQRFQEASRDNYCDPKAVHFVPALGGGFLVVQDEQDATWLQTVRRALSTPVKLPQSLIDDFWKWLQLERPLIAAGQKVMVIDDDPTILTMLRVVLESSGYSVQAFSDAKMALAAVGKPESPTVMVVDLRMPGMDGRSFVNEIKARDVESKIIIASAYKAKEAERELNADGSIEKPFEPDDLVSLVRTIGNSLPQESASGVSPQRVG